MDKFDLADRTAVVTGASRGIGFEVARHLCSRGAQVAICSRNQSEIERAAGVLREEYGAHVWAAALDVSSPNETVRFSAQVLERLGPSDLLVNNAAVLGPVGVLGHDDAESWSQTLDINIKGVAFITAAFRSQLQQSGRGRVVNLSGGGVGGPRPMRGVSAYLCSKYAVAGLTEALSAELSEFGVTVNAIAPGSHSTSFMDGVIQVGLDVAGEELYQDASWRTGVVSRDEIKPFLELIDFVFSDAASNLSGRLLSARWDLPESLLALTSDQLTDDLLRLRRIDSVLFSGVES